MAAQLAWVESQDVTRMNGPSHAAALGSKPRCAETSERHRFSSIGYSAST